jgi:methionyl-tRNA formyltransferase
MASGNIVFFGTPQLCIPFLKSLKKEFTLSFIITQPDAVGRRNRKKIPPAVKCFARENHIDFEQPETLKNTEIQEKIKEYDPDIGVVISYGKIIPESIFKIPRFNTINVHFSLLPLYRGAAPVQRALEKGETKTGITIFEIDKKLDTGDIWAKQEFSIQPSDTAETLLNRLCDQGSPFMIKTIQQIFKQQLSKKPQNHPMATYARTIKKEEGRVDWNLTAQQIFNKYRGFFPWPGLFCFIDQKRIKLTKIQVAFESPSLDSLLVQKNPGDILKLDRDFLAVCCGNKSILLIEEFQPEGKKNMTPFHFSLGNPIPPKLN